MSAGTGFPPRDAAAARAIGRRRLLVDRLPAMLALAGLFGALAGVAGALTSTRFAAIPTGAAVVLTGLLMFGGALAVSRWRA